MYNFLRTTANNSDFLKLTRLLDKELLDIYRSEQAKFDKHNILPKEVKSIIIYAAELPIGCGAFKELEDEETIEIKRMFVKNDFRSKGIGKRILSELEKWALELNYKFAILELGNDQPAAFSLYKKLEYTQISKFPPYENMHDSICMKKRLSYITKLGNFS